MVAEIRVQMYEGEKKEWGGWIGVAIATLLNNTNLATQASAAVLPKSLFRYEVSVA